MDECDTASPFFTNATVWPGEKKCPQFVRAMTKAALVVFWRRVLGDANSMKRRFIN
jgi:hypothetical protein